MRFAAALAVLWALPLAAAPVPKELRTPALVGTWEITSTDVWGETSPQYNGQRWRFGAEGSFTISEGLASPRLRGSYVLGKAGLDIVFGEHGVPAQSLFECDETKLRLANTKKNEVRPASFALHADTVTYTYKRVKE